MCIGKLPLYLIIHFDFYSENTLESFRDYKKLYDGCYVFTTGGCGDHNYLFFYFIFMSIFNFCFGVFWNIRTRSSIKMVGYVLEKVDCKISSLNDQAYNKKLKHEVLLIFPEGKEAFMLPTITRAQRLFPCQKQKLRKERVCQLLSQFRREKGGSKMDGKVGSNVLRPEMIEYVHTSEERKDVDIIDTNKPEDKRIKEQFLVLTMAVESERWKVFGNKKSRFENVKMKDNLGAEFSCFVRFLLKKDLVKTESPIKTNEIMKPCPV